MRLASIAAALALPLTLALAGCAEESFLDAGDAADELETADEELAEAGSAIVGGAVDDGHAAVVALTFHGQAFCSGTLVSPTVVVTAAHCLHEAYVPQLRLEDVRVFFGTDVKGAGSSIEVLEATIHPDFIADDPEQDDDIALIRLAMEAPVAPLPMGGTPAEGTRVTLVGFGRPGAEVAETGVKRVGSSTIQLTTPRLFVLELEPHGTCKGDSGGTAIATIDGVETFVGVHTRSDCKTGMIDERVDAHFEGFIRPFIGSGTCVGCDPEDDGAGGGAAPGGAGGDHDADDGADVETAAADAGADDETTSRAFGACAVGPTAAGGSGSMLALLAIVALASMRRRA